MGYICVTDMCCLSKLASTYCLDIRSPLLAGVLVGPSHSIAICIQYVGAYSNFAFGGLHCRFCHGPSEHFFAEQSTGNPYCSWIKDMDCSATSRFAV